MALTKVAIVKQDTYEPRSLARALKQSLDFIGGIESVVLPKSSVFVKINHLSPPSLPDKAVVTHPALTKEVLKTLNKLECSVTVGDDIQSKGQDGFVISGYRQVCEELDIRLVNLKETGFRKIGCGGKHVNEIYVSPLVLDADCVINLPKLKTHSFTVYTGAVKNMYGIIPMGLRHSYHRRFINPEIFSQMLVDIYSCAPPQLTVMDAVIAMEGEGPSAGNPRHVGLILTSSDGVAVDAVASKITGFNPLSIYSTQNATERGLGQGDLNQIEIVGLPIRDVAVNDFSHSAVAVGLLRRKIPSFLYGYLQDQLVYIPEVNRNTCTECLECVDICPKGAAKHLEQRVIIDTELCIHCMCCHEVCRYHSIRLKQLWMGRMIRLMDKIYQKMKSLFS
jgi:uncharacterized protein (DUF362 family)/ferredoxin